MTVTPPTGTPAPTASPTGAAMGADRRTDMSLRYDRLLAGLADRVTSRAVGQHLPGRTRLAGSPQERLWLGMLASEHQIAADQAAGRLRTNRIIPAAQGFTFRVEQLPLHLDLRASISIYRAVTPTLTEEVASVSGDPGDDGDDTSDGSDSTDGAPTPPPAPAGGRGTVKHKLAQIWVKGSTDTIHIPVDLPATPGSRSVGDTELNAALAAAVTLPADTGLFRPRRATGRPPGSLPTDADLVDETTWASYCATNLTDASDVLAPVHAARIQIDITRVDAGWEIAVALINSSPTLDNQIVNAAGKTYERAYVDTLLYEADLSADVPAGLVPYELAQVARSYRYDRTVAAFGQGGAVDITEPAGTGNRGTTASNADGSQVEAPARGGVTTLRTLFAAQQPTLRVDVRDSFTSAEGTNWPIDTSFTTLINDPLPALDALVAAHRAWVEQEWSEQSLTALAADRGWDAAALDAARKDARHAADEVGWVAAGVDLIRTDVRVRDSFIGANRAVSNAAVEPDGTVSYTAWYPFQLAWIVGCLPGMVDPATHPKVNIVWFATGGGKSEAYLGLMLAHLFYSRYSGVTAGTTVWARFPLRLLALQQTARFARMIFHAELIRRELVDAKRLPAGDPFGIGYFAGSGNTPNKLEHPSSRFYRGTDPFADETAASCRVLEMCPLCGNDIVVEFHEPSWTMRHLCRTRGCDMRGILPIWSVDHDVYRYAPAVLVGTVDKLAQLGQQRLFQVLLGRATLRCHLHGYAVGDSCSIFGCTAATDPLTPGDHTMTGVRLEIADELHLLEESLGALDGMYETLLQAINAQYGNAPLQIVGATATIEGYETQVQHLYQRDARRFPVNGPNVGETFWSITSDIIPLRRFLGIQPRRITMVTASREIAVTHHQWLQDLLTRPADVLTEAGLNPSEQVNVEVAAAAAEDLYEVLLTYGLRTQDLSAFMQDNEVRDLIERERNLAVISGDQDPADIRDAVTRLVNPPADPGERVRLIAATKAIGHGFDVARLGVMTVMGTPTTAAEIIQASARVGRRWPGLVIYIVNPTRDRDVSVYRYFSSWISFLDRLVNDVPVNRDSLPILERVLSGGLMALLLQVYDQGWLNPAGSAGAGAAGGIGGRRKSLYQSTEFRDADRAGYLSRAALSADLRKAFGVHPTSALFDRHRAAIDDWVGRAMTNVAVSAEAGKATRDLLSPSVPTSLRDIEEPIRIFCELP